MEGATRGQCVKTGKRWGGGARARKDLLFSGTRPRPTSDGPRVAHAQRQRLPAPAPVRGSSGWELEGPKQAGGLGNKSGGEKEVRAL